MQVRLNFVISSSTILVHAPSLYFRCDIYNNEFEFMSLIVTPEFQLRHSTVLSRSRICIRQHTTTNTNYKLVRPCITIEIKNFLEFKVLFEFIIILILILTHYSGIIMIYYNLYDNFEVINIIILIILHIIYDKYYLLFLFFIFFFFNHFFNFFMIFYYYYIEKF